MTNAARPRVIATRLYFTTDGTTVTARLCEPVESRPQEWSCVFTISGLAEDIRGEGRGIDSLQAIIVGL